MPYAFAAGVELNPVPGWWQVLAAVRDLPKEQNTLIARSCTHRYLSEAHEFGKGEISGRKISLPVCTLKVFIPKMGDKRDACY